MSISSLTYRRAEADIEFKNISYQVRIKKKAYQVILNNATGSFQHGQIHAIMGPSGCGKSSLLNVLAGFNPIAKGEVSLNGTSVDCKKWKHLITPVRSYIMQNDSLIAELTVKEQLSYAVEFKVTNDTPKKERMQIVETLLQETGLKECENIRLCQISGGQRKRVSVASELVNYPPVLFLDEPTTGLDSTSCYRLIDLLKSVARTGCNVIATIHQPNSRVFAMFDTLTVLYDEGKIAFRGPAVALAETIQRCNNIKLPSTENPAEVLFDGDNIKKLAECDPVRRQLFVDRVSKSFSNSINGESNGKMTAERIKDICIRQLPSSGYRFRTVFRRAILQARRDPVFTAGRLATYTFTSALCGINFQFVGNDAKLATANIGYMFIMMLVYTMGTGIVTIMNSPAYLDVLIRENINSWYGASPFFLSRAIIEVIVTIVVSLIFSNIMWIMTAQQQVWWPTVIALPYTMFMHCMAIYQLCFIISMFADRPSLPQLPFALVMLQTVFGGYFVKFSAVPDWLVWMRYLTHGSFTFSSILKLGYSSVIGGDQVEIPCNSWHPLCQRYRTGDDMLPEFGIDKAASYWVEIYQLAAHIAGLFIIGWLLTPVYLRKERKAIARI